ncbi:MAG TPA: hypothetical protein VLZ28_03520 [Daejeonella sp.]|nr:hypothetical protein [Daejeonella sp.]
MKKIILLLLIASVGVAACKKEKKSSTRADKPIEEAILGVWLTTSEIHDYYNANNEKVFSRTVEPGWKYTINEQVRLANPQGESQFRVPYTITNNNGTNWISFTARGSTEMYEITSLEQETMSWKQEKTNVTYNDNGEKTAAREVITYTFHCPCK